MKGISKISQKEPTRKMLLQEKVQRAPDKESQKKSPKLAQKESAVQIDNSVFNIDLLKEALLLQRSHILNQASEFRSEHICRTDALKDDSDRVSNDLIQNVSIRLFERDSSSLMAIDQALGRISAGTYGQCEACWDQIPAARLMARPFATMCICCMEEQENQKNTVF